MRVRKLAAILAIFVFFTGCEGKTAGDVVAGVFKPNVARGYEQVKWGSSPEEVRKIYNIGPEIQITHEEDDLSSSIGRLVQRYVSESISERIFMFHENKLYRVWVTYVQGADIDYIRGTLTAKYGEGVLEEKSVTSTVKVPKTYGQPVPNGRGGWVMGKVNGFDTEKITITNCSVRFNKYSPNIEVELLYGYKQSTQVCYTWKTERDKFKR